MNNSIAMVDVKSNLEVMLQMIDEQKAIVSEQSKRFKKNRKAATKKVRAIKKAGKEVEVKGKEREALIRSVEELLNTRLEKDVVLVRAEGDSSRFVRCIYKTGTTLKDYLTTLARSHTAYFETDDVEENLETLYTRLHNKKVLKKNYYPYSSGIARGYFEEKPASIILDRELNASRVDNEVYITVEGMNRLRFKELSPVYKAVTEEE